MGTMTQAWNEADAWRIRFFMPARATRESLPEPNDPAVRIITVPAQTVAVAALLRPADAGRGGGGADGAAGGTRRRRLGAGGGTSAAWFYDPTLDELRSPAGGSPN